MSGFFLPDCPTRYRKRPAFLLALSFISGLTIGVLTSFDASIPFFSAMRAASQGCVSIIGLLSAMLLPFLFSAFAVYIKKSALLYFIAFIKAFLLAFVGTGVMCAFDTAGWLMRWLIMFSDLLFVPFLYWYWHENITTPHSLKKSGIMILLPVMLALSLVEYYYVAPLLAEII